MMLCCPYGVRRGTCGGGGGSGAFFVGGRPKSEKGGKGVGVWWPLQTAPGRPPTLAFFGTAPPEAGKGGKGGNGAAQSRAPPPSPPLPPSQSVARRIAFASGCSKTYSRSR